MNSRSFLALLFGVAGLYCIAGFWAAFVWVPLRFLLPGGLGAIATQIVLGIFLLIIAIVLRRKFWIVWLTGVAGGVFTFFWIFSRIH